jgi:hypothetical protein
VIFEDYLIVTSVIIITTVELVVCITLDLGCIQAKEEDLLIVKYLKLLVLSEVILESL